MLKITVIILSLTFAFVALSLLGNNNLFAEQTTLIETLVFKNDYQDVERLTKGFANDQWGVNLFCEPYGSTLSFTTDGDGYFDIPEGHALTFVTDPCWNRIVYYDHFCLWIKSYGNSDEPGIFNSPHGITSDQYSWLPSRFNAYIADTGNDRIVHLPFVYYYPPYTAPIVMPSSHTFTDPIEGLNQPLDVDLNDNGTLVDDTDDYLWVADYGNHKIKRFQLLQQWIHIAGSGPGDDGIPDEMLLVARYGGYGSGVGQFKYPRAITNGKDWQTGKNNKYLYVADTGNNRIVKLYNPDSTTVQWVETYDASPGSYLTSLSTDTYGNLWVTDYANGRILKLASDLELITTVGSIGIGEDQFLYPTGFSTTCAYQHSWWTPDHWIRGFADVAIGEQWTDDSGGRHYRMGVDVLNLNVTTNSSQSTAYCSFTLTDQAAVTVKVYDGGTCIQTLRDNVEMTVGAVGPITWNAKTKPWKQYRIEITASSLYLLNGTGPSLNTVVESGYVWVGQKPPQITAGPIIYYGSENCVVKNHTYPVCVSTNDLTGQNFSYNWSVIPDPTHGYQGTINGSGASVQYTAPNYQWKDPSPPKNTISVSVCYEGSCDDGSTAAFFIYSSPCNPPNGCPFLFTWNGSEFVEDNNILPPTEDTLETGNITDYYKLRYQPVKYNNKYHFQIKEFENEHSYIDQVRFLIVNYPEDAFIDVLPDGEIITYRTFSPPLSCIDQNGEDSFELINLNDSLYFDGQQGDWLSIDFGEIGKSLPFIKLISANKNYQTIVVQSQGEKEWEDISLVHPRENWSSQLASIPSSAFSDSGGLELRLDWRSDHKLNYVGFLQPEQVITTNQLFVLASAVHSQEGDVLENLVSIDEEYVELLPGEQIDLAFSTDFPPPPLKGQKQAFIFVSTGYYTTEKTYANVPETIGDGQIPTSFYLSQNYPNPFNLETEIGYALPKNSYVTLKIYNIQGQLVKDLVDEEKQAGYYKVLWDGENNYGDEVASGLYFYQIKAGDFMKTKKIVLLK